MTLPFPEPPQSICILRLSAIGDVMHMAPVVRTLQNHWPTCKITWIIGKLEATLIGDIPGVEFIIFDKQAGLKTFFDLHRHLANREFDLLLHMQVAMRASLISLLVKAPIKLGFDKARAHDYQYFFTSQRIDAKPRQHVLDGFFGFLEKIGINDRCMKWDIPIPDQAKQRINQLIPNRKPLLLINPCSSTRARNWRNWPAKNYAQIADYAEQKHDLQIVLSGGASQIEQDMATQIAHYMISKPINLVGQTSLKELLALIEQATLLIAPDTGPAHMAAAVDTQVIGLYASSNPLRTGPYLSQQWTVNRYPEAAKSFLGRSIEELHWGQRVRNPQAMKLITVEDVAAKLDSLMKQQ